VNRQDAKRERASGALHDCFAAKLKKAKTISSAKRAGRSEAQDSITQKSSLAQSPLDEELPKRYL
jgi:hypothetical protein